MTNADSLAQNPVLVFDWGNTVMKVWPQYSGPMAHWPEVAAVDGISAVLDALKSRYTLVLASNAGDSDASLVRNALSRVGLDKAFQAVFTAHELNARKPQVTFFRRLESALNRPPHHLILIGDDYTTDVLGAKQAGWQAIWYNPGGQPAPGLLPLHDEEILHLRALPEVLNRRPLPDYTQTLAWLLETGTPFNILNHIQLVAAVAYLLAIWLRAAGQPVNPILTQRGAMLHDLAKITSIHLRRERGVHGDHARMAADVLLARNQPELAAIADRHMPVSDPSAGRAPVTWEEKLVHFADKLAEGACLVTPAERFAALLDRYPDFQAELQASQPHLLRLQDEICALLRLSPDELFARLKQAVSF